jgi:NTP pyrophosphatase (non-canonical NTP hydrolase)
MLNGTHETQDSIEAWADEQFGLATDTTLPRILARANEEMAELVRATICDGTRHEVAEEAADVVIVLCRAAAMTGEDLTPFMGLTEIPATPASFIAANANGLLSFAIQGLMERTIAHNNVGIYVGLIARQMAQVCAAIGMNLQEAIDEKMAVNRTRKWSMERVGLFYHVHDAARVVF